MIPILHQYCIKDVRGGIQIRVYTIDKDVVPFSQFISVKVEKLLRNLRLYFGKS